jgi:starch-binding outer membrane protein, SusD/RagB family
MKIRNKICQLIAVIAVCCVSFSCSDDFYTEPAGNRITPDEHFKSQKDLYISIIGTYIPLQTAMPKLLLIDALRSDMGEVTSFSDPYMKSIYNQELSTDNPYLDGSDYYKVIIDVNEILEHIDEVWVKDPTEIEYEPKFTTGALVTIRAWSYLTLVRLFGKAALITDNMPSLTSGQLFLNKRDMIDTLINQLKPYVFDFSKLTELSIWGPNTKALLGELYLENQQYDSAAYYLKLGIESYGNTKAFKVTNAYAKEKWELIFYGDGIGVENLDLVAYYSHKDQYNDFTGWSLNRAIVPTQLLVNTYKAQVPTSSGKGDLYRGKGFTYDTVPGSYYIAKYNLEEGDPYSAYICLSRSADIHLLLAEALNQLGDYTTALLLVNNGIRAATPTPQGYNKWSDNIGVRGRVSLQPKTLGGIDLNDPVAVRNTVDEIILEERKLELAFEGKRWFDLVRIAERRNDPYYLANKVADKYSDPVQAERVRNILLDPSNWYIK